MADYGGDPIFGYSPTIVMEQNPSEAQLNTFFGISGVQSLYGGGRGRLFLCSGLLVGATIDDLLAARNNFISYDDGIARTLTDTWGAVWPNVVFERFQQQGRVVQLAGGLGLAIEYRATFAGRI